MELKVFVVLSLCVCSAAALSCGCNGDFYKRCKAQDHAAVLRACPMGGLWGLQDSVCPCNGCYLKRCANGLLQKCGGPWGITGTCGNFLRCVTPTDDWGETGICWIKGLDCPPPAQKDKAVLVPIDADMPVPVPLPVEAKTLEAIADLKDNELLNLIAKITSNDA